MNAQHNPSKPEPKSHHKKRFKWEPAAAMVALFLLGIWLVFAGRTLTPQNIRDGAYTLPLQLGNERGLVEVFVPKPPLGNAEPIEFRILYRSGDTLGPITYPDFAQRFGEPATDALLSSGANPLFKLFNITSWTSLAWIAVGFGGQTLFFLRMAVQWIASERERRSVIPPAFWIFSLAGGVALFAYFAWRQDIVGVTGQTSGIVIYARNLRLIYKENRRARRTLADNAHAADPTPAG